MHRIKDTSQPLIKTSWNDLFNDEHSIHQLENQVLPVYLKRMRWFGGKARPVKGIKLYQNIPVALTNDIARYVLIKVRYDDGPTEIYALPLMFLHSRSMISGSYPSQSIVARMENEHHVGFLIDAIYDEGFRTALFSMMSRNFQIKGAHYPLHFAAGKYLLENKNTAVPESKVLGADQSNSAIVYNNAYFLKLFRKVEYAINPDQEIVQFLTEQDRFHQIPSFAGCAELEHPEKPRMLLMMMQQMVSNQGDAWNRMLHHVDRYFEEVAETGYHQRPLPLKPHLLFIAWEKTPEALQKLIGVETFNEARLLGRRTAELHLALGDSKGNSEFEPLAMDEAFQKSLHNELLHLLETKFDLLERNLHRVPPAMRDEAAEMLTRRNKVRTFFTKLLEKPLEGQRIRIHGDYHLGQVLVTEDDMVILDFEGEPDKPYTERREKYPPLKDVAGMMRSFRYAAYATMFSKYGEENTEMVAVADLWYHFVSRFFLGSYLETMQGSGLIPGEERVNDLLQIYSFQKAIYELGYEINNRPDWALIPLQSLVKFVKHYID